MADAVYELYGDAVAKRQDEIVRLRRVILNIQSLAERGLPIDAAKLVKQCRTALEHTKRSER